MIGSLLNTNNKWIVRDINGIEYPLFPEDNLYCLDSDNGLIFDFEIVDEHAKLINIRNKEDYLYSKIENLIIEWSIDGKKTAGHLTRKIMEIIK